MQSNREDKSEGEVLLDINNTDAHDNEPQRSNTESTSAASESRNRQFAAYDRKTNTHVFFSIPPNFNHNTNARSAINTANTLTFLMGALFFLDGAIRSGNPFEMGFGVLSMLAAVSTQCFSIAKDIPEYHWRSISVSGDITTEKPEYESPRP